MKKLIFIIILTVALVGLSATATFGNEYHFGKFGIAGYGARADAMGGAFAAVADDGFGPLYNPAGITQLTAPVINGDFGYLWGGRYSDNLIISGMGGITAPWGAVNLCFDECNSMLGEEEIYTASYNLVLSKAITLSKSSAIGGNVKLVYDVSGGADRNTTTDGANIVFDLGWLNKPSNSVSWGVVARDIGIPITDLFPSLDVGFAYKPTSSTTIAADVDLTLYFGLYDTFFIPIPMGHLGIEQTILQDSFAFRLGISGLPSQGLSAVTGGFGFKILGVNTDMAILCPFNSNIGVEISSNFKL